MEKKDIPELKPHPRSFEIDQLAKAATRGLGNRKERRREQAELKRLMRRR